MVRYVMIGQNLLGVGRPQGASRILWYGRTDRPFRYRTMFTYTHEVNTRIDDGAGRQEPSPMTRQSTDGHTSFFP